MGTTRPLRSLMVNPRFLKILTPAMPAGVRALEHRDVIGGERRLVDLAEVDVAEDHEPARRCVVIARQHAIELRAEAAAQVHGAFDAQVVHRLQQRRGLEAGRPVRVDVRGRELRPVDARDGRDQGRHGVVRLEDDVADEDRLAHRRVLFALLRQRPGHDAAEPCPTLAATSQPPTF